MIDKQAPISNINTATGLAGEVKVFDPPHTEENYLMQEMGFVIGRKHGAKLRRLALVLGVAIPVLAVMLAQVAGGWLAVLLCFIALASQVVAIFTERWLFFAQAQHTVALYYGR